MKNIIYITITCLFISVTNLFAVDLTGEYSAKGTTPGPENAKNYKGTASIKKTGES